MDNKLGHTDAMSDALVVFGATGDLARKKIFPALYAMCRRGALKVPVIGVASSAWSIEQFRAHAKESVERADDACDQNALARLLSLLQYVSGDYNDAATFDALKRSLGSAQRPAHYLAWISTPRRSTNAGPFLGARLMPTFAVSSPATREWRLAC